MYKIKYTGTIISRYPRIGTVIAIQCYKDDIPH